MSEVQIEEFYKLSEAVRIRLAQRAREAGVPLMERWRDMTPSIYDQWQDRAARR